MPNWHSYSPFSQLFSFQRIDWSCSLEDKNNCDLKGKSDPECQNYIRVLSVIGKSNNNQCIFSDVEDELWMNKWGIYVSFCRVFSPIDQVKDLACRSSCPLVSLSTQVHRQPAVRKVVVNPLVNFESWREAQTLNFASESWRKKQALANCGLWESWKLLYRGNPISKISRILERKCWLLDQSKDEDPVTMTVVIMTVLLVLTLTSHF